MWRYYSLSNPQTILQSKFGHYSMPINIYIFALYTQADGLSGTDKQTDDPFTRCSKRTFLVAAKLWCIFSEILWNIQTTIFLLLWPMSTTIGPWIRWSILWHQNYSWYTVDNVDFSLFYNLQYTNMGWIIDILYHLIIILCYYSILKKDKEALRC